MNCDIVIVGAGPAGIFTALELVRKKSRKKILMVEKGNPVQGRRCPKNVTGQCVNCKPYCHITTGFSGAGAFSDGKLSLSSEVGGDLPMLIGETLAQEKANRELKSVNAALRESARRAENLREQVTSEQEKRSRLIRSVSRGIRTPLNAVLGLTTLMNMTKDSEDMKQFARQIQAQVQKVMAVLEDSREERKPVDLGDCAQQAAGGAKRLEGVHVLLAEGGELNAEILQKLLTNEGAACDRVADGLQALRQFEAAADGTYDVILMDMQMPVMDGCEAARAIRASGREDAENIPIIAMTANSFDDVRERIFEAGMNGYLGKPVEPGKPACAVRGA